MKLRRQILLALTLLMVATLICTSCGNVMSEVDTARDESGNFVVETERERSVTVKSIPADVSYNETRVGLQEVQAYEECSNYSYTLFIVTKLDVSSLNEKELHWLQENDLNVNIYITSMILTVHFGLEICC